MVDWMVGIDRTIGSHGAVADKRKTVTCTIDWRIEQNMIMLGRSCCRSDRQTDEKTLEAR